MSKSSYRIVQSIELACDANGRLCAWHPYLERPYAVDIYGIRLLQGFGSGACLPLACENSGIECDDRAKAVGGKLIDRGFLVPLDDENDDLKRGPFVFRDIEGLSIRVRSIAESVRFYRDTLGMLTYVQDGGTMAVRAGETALHLEEAASDDITATKICLTLRYTEFEAAVKKFSEEEISYEPVRSAPELRALRLLDPSGHVVSIRQEPMKTSYTMFQTLLGKLEDGESFSHANDRRASWVGPVNRSENSGFWANWREGNITHVPWNCVHLDDDLVEAMSIWSKVPGRFVEFGCGSGMASARLAALGYSVVGIDLSKANIELACRSYEAQNERLEYHVWDVTKPMESFGVFDYGFDRGCFHQLPHDKRERYVENVYDIMRPGGRLFLKTFSRSEPGSWGPSRFSSHEIASIFASKFLIVEQSPSCFESRLTHQPKALFSVLKRL